MTEVLVVGCGSIGTRHVGNLLDLGVDVRACDVDPERTAPLADEHGIETTTDYEVGLEAGPDCVLVCTPPSTHVEIASAALDAGAATFVEKPLAPTSGAAEALAERATESDRVVYVACNMRFHPPVERIDDRLAAGRIGEVQFLRLRYGNDVRNWRPGDYRDYYSASSDQGGGVVLDAIHEIDVADHWLGGTERVCCEAGRFGDLDIETEDVAEILLRNDERLAEVHLDYLRPVRARTYEVVGSDGMVRWHATGKDPEVSRVALHDADGALVESREYELTLNEMYVAELEDFLACVAGRETPPVDAARGARLVRLAELAKRATRGGTVQRLE